MHNPCTIYAQLMHLSIVDSSCRLLEQAPSGVGGAPMLPPHSISSRVIPKKEYRFASINSQGFVLVDTEARAKPLPGSGYMWTATVDTVSTVFSRSCSVLFGSWYAQHRPVPLFATLALC